MFFMHGDSLTATELPFTDTCIYNSCIYRRVYCKKQCLLRYMPTGYFNSLVTAVLLFCECVNNNSL